MTFIRDVQVLLLVTFWECNPPPFPASIPINTSSRTNPRSRKIAFVYPTHLPPSRCFLTDLSLLRPADDNRQQPLFQETKNIMDF